MYGNESFRSETLFSSNITTASCYLHNPQHDRLYLTTVNFSLISRTKPNQLTRKAEVVLNKPVVCIIVLRF